MSANSEDTNSYTLDSNRIPTHAPEYDTGPIKSSDTNDEPPITNPESASINALLYPNATVTVHGTLILILVFTLTHKLTNEELTDLLSPQMSFWPNLISSVYKLYTLLKLKKKNTNFVRHYYCPSCQYPFND